MKPFFSSTERGQALILISLASIGIVAIAGLAIDGSAKFSDRRHAQNAADAAVLAGSLANLRHEPDWETIAKDRAMDNGYDGDLVHNRIWVYSCDVSQSDVKRSTVPNGIDCGSYEGDDRYVQVVIQSYVNTYFSRVIGIRQMRNTVEAIAMSQESYTGELYGGASIVGLAPDQCRTVWLAGSSAISVTGGGIFSNSNQVCGVTVQGANGFEVGMDSSIQMVATGFSNPGSPDLSDISGGFVGGAEPYDYPPPAGMLPNISCSGSATRSGTSMNPGSWSGAFPPSGVKTLNPGTYCVDGNFRLNAHDELTGTGVTIYMKSGDIDWNGGATVNLSAPASGDYPGLLIYSPMSNTNTMQFNGNASSLLTGTIFMPAAPIVYNGTGNLNPSHVQLIGYTVKITGSNTTNVIYQDPDNWDANMPALIGIMQ
jgi:hypothetical protein